MLFTTRPALLAPSAASSSAAGGGGFILLFVPPGRQEKVREKLSRLIHVPFAFEFSGSQIIFFDLEEDFAKHDKDRASQQIEAFREWNSEPSRTLP